MDFEELKKQMDELTNELKKEPPEYKYLKTDSGKNFQDNFVELMGILNISNIIALISPIISIMIKIFSNGVEEFAPSVKEKALKKENLSDSELEDTLKILLEKFLSTDSDTKMNEIITKFLNQINSYYFLALYAYIDLYSMSIYKYVISNLEEEQLFDIVINFNAMDNPTKRIGCIKKTLNLINETRFNKLLRGRTWKESIEKLIELRNFLAHRDPILRKSLLEEKFPKTVKTKALKQTKKVFQQEAFNNLNNHVLTKIRKIIEPNLLILFMLIEIGKDCYGYLALIDTLFDDYF